MRKVLLSLVSGLVLLASGAEAAAEVSGKAEVVFSSGARIFSMNADGSDRRQLVGGAYDPAVPGTWKWRDEFSPAISPDGRYLAYLGWSNRLHEAVYRVANRDGSGSRVVFTGKIQNESLGEPVWTPDNRLLVTVQRWPARKGIQLSRVISMQPDGSDRKVLYERIDGKQEEEWIPPVDQVDLAPDGRRLLISLDYDTVGIGFRLQSPLFVLNLSSGKARLISSYGSGATWSPDGKRILFESTAEQIGYHCWDIGSCTYETKLYVVRANGRGLRRITPRQSGSDHGASWSPDGSRIIFLSDRSDPNSSLAQEVYSVRPDGSCLTWVTNGTPEVDAVNWGPEKDRDFGPGSCDPELRQPDLSFSPRPWKKRDGSASKLTPLWLGPVYQGRLANQDIYNNPGQFEYADCSFFELSSCGPEREFTWVRICSPYYGSRWMFADGYFSHLEARRGALVAVSRPRWGGVSKVLHSGGAQLSLDATGEIVDQLRAVGESDASGPLPAAVFPRGRVNMAAKVDATLVETGSVEETAAELDLTSRQVNSWKRFHDEIQRVGPVATLKCAR